MKKSIFTISFIIISLFFSFSFVFATDNNMDNLKNNMMNTVNSAGNVVQDAAEGTAGAVQNGMNTVGDKSREFTNNIENAGNDMMDNVNSDYTATRTAAENNTTPSNIGYDNIWTWIIVGVIAIVVIALIWYFVSQNNE